MRKSFYIILFSSFGGKTHAGVPGERRCEVRFDGPRSIFGHGFFPSDGRIHFDEDDYFTETGTTTGWWFWAKESVSVLYVAVHEIGHALGLGHSNVRGSTMWPTGKTGTPRLTQDDADAIRALYGECVLKNIYAILILSLLPSCINLHTGLINRREEFDLG